MHFFFFSPQGTQERLILTQSISLLQGQGGGLGEGRETQVFTHPVGCSRRSTDLLGQRPQQTERRSKTGEKTGPFPA